MDKRYSTTKYLTTAKNLERKLAKYGVAIIPNVLGEQECKEMVDGFWDFFEHISQEWEVPLNRDVKESWSQFSKLYPMHSMLIQHWGIGHSQFIWDIRQNEKVVDIFAQFWKCPKEALQVSFDGASFSCPPEGTNRGWNRDHTWYHTDQSYTNSAFRTLQSWITGLDVNEGDATLAIMEKSHHYHKECGDQFKLVDKDNWHKLTAAEEDFYVSKGCAYKYIKAPKGSLVLWDSRLIHCGVEPSKSRLLPNFRAVAYLCYTPTTEFSEKDLEKRRGMLKDLRMTTHGGKKMFSKTPQTYGGEIPRISAISAPHLSALGKSLAGL